MKTIRLFPVSYLRVYATPIERTSKVNKVKSVRVAGLVLNEMLPDADGNETDNRVIEFTAKQLDNLCTVCRVKGVGRQRWDDFAELIGTSESVATITLEPHRKGDSYVGTDGNEHEFESDGVSTSVDSITFGLDTKKELKSAVINRQVNWTAVNNSMKDLLAGMNIGSPKITAEQNSAPVDPAVAGK